MYTGNNIKLLRKRLKMTQGEIAEKIDKTITTVGDYERGKSIPPLDIANKLCEIFQVNLDDLVNKDLSKEGTGRPEEEAPRSGKKPTSVDEELFRQLLVLKLEEVSNRLKETNPELYEELRLDVLVKDQKKKKGLE